MEFVLEKGRKILKTALLVFQYWKTKKLGTGNPGFPVLEN